MDFAPVLVEAEQSEVKPQEVEKASMSDLEADPVEVVEEQESIASRVKKARLAREQEFVKDETSLPGKTPKVKSTKSFKSNPFRQGSYKRKHKSIR